MLTLFDLIGKRLADSKKADTSTSPQSPSSNGSKEVIKEPLVAEVCEVVRPSLSNVIDTVPIITSIYQTVSPPGSYTSSCDGQTNPTNQDLLLRRVSTVFAALFNNGRILNIPFGLQVPILSQPCTAAVPPSLHPTETQMTILHFPWIDRFPFPKMRDNVIRLCGIIDEEEFLADIFTTDSFTIVPDSVSWDPMGWVISKQFEQKWGYLFY